MKKQSLFSWKDYPSPWSFTQALLVMLVTFRMSAFGLPSLMSPILQSLLISLFCRQKYKKKIILKSNYIFFIKFLITIIFDFIISWIGSRTWFARLLDFRIIGLVYSTICNIRKMFLRKIIFPPYAIFVKVFVSVGQSLSLTPSPHIIFFFIYLCIIIYCY